MPFLKNHKVFNCSEQKEGESLCTVQLPRGPHGENTLPWWNLACRFAFLRFERRQAWVAKDMWVEEPRVEEVGESSKASTVACRVAEAVRVEVDGAVESSSTRADSLEEVLGGERL